MHYNNCVQNNNAEGPNAKGFILMNFTSISIITILLLYLRLQLLLPTIVFKYSTLRCSLLFKSPVNFDFVNCMYPTFTYCIFDSFVLVLYRPE